MNDSAVIITARKRSRAALTAASAAGAPASRRTFANTAIRIAFCRKSDLTTGDFCVQYYYYNQRK